MKTFNVMVPIRMPQTPTDWQLYTASAKDFPPGALDNAARQLTVQLEMAAQFIAEQCMDAPPQLVHAHVQSALHQYMRPVMERHSKLGANDTEPREIAWAVLERLARKVSAR